MDNGTFDRLTMLLGRFNSRRAMAGSFAVLTFPSLADGKKRRRKKRRNRKIQRNAFGCVEVGNLCKTSEQCCSGICQGKKDRKTCQAHDATTCQAGAIPAVCGGVHTFCISSDGYEGACATTTGNGGYCFASGDCFACTKDADCEAVCGPGATCLPCAATCGPERGVTFCAGLAADSCDFDM